MLGKWVLLLWRESNQGQKEPGVGRMIKGWCDQSGSEHVSQPSGGPKEGAVRWFRFRLGQRWDAWTKERILNQSFLDKNFVPIDPWDKTIQLFMYKAKNGNLEGLCLALS